MGRRENIPLSPDSMEQYHEEKRRLLCCSAKVVCAERMRAGSVQFDFESPSPRLPVPFRLAHPSTIECL